MSGRGDLPVGPFRDWLRRKVAEHGAQEVANRCGAQERAVRRVLEEQVAINTDTVDKWLTRYGEETIDDLYPLDYDERRDEEFCFTCRAFVPPTVDDACPWCEAPILRPDLSTLPPRERQEREDAPTLKVVHRPRRRMPPRPLYLDVLLDERRTALEVFAATHSLRRAGEVIAHRFSGNVESATTAVRNLMTREGWYKPPGRSPSKRKRAANAAAKRVRKALRDGSWDRVVEQQPLDSLRRIFGDDVLYEAAWLYFYDELGFDTIARRLVHRCTTNNVRSIKHALADEWERRGWPKRTKHGQAQARRGRWDVPEDRRCIHPGCRRFAANVGRYCVDHDPDRDAERARANGRKASAAANYDAVDITPFRLWLERRLELTGQSLLAFSRTVPVSYDWLHNVRRGEAKVVRRRTIDKLCSALEDVTFESIYFPVTDDELAA